jgi:MFS family permease
VIIVPSHVRAVLRELRGYPRQFWVLVGGTFVYVGAAALAFPYEAIFLRRTLGVSLTWIGILFGVVPLMVMPLQFWAGALTDRIGRRWMIVSAAVSAVIWFTGFAFARSLWQVALLVALESVVGWPLFQTASGAMIADLFAAERRAEAFSISRVAMNAGVVGGPALGGLALAAGLTFRGLFLVAAGGCFIFLLLALAFIRETRPAAALEQRSHEGRTGYRILLADHRYQWFCVVAVLPVACFGVFSSLFPVFITDTLGVAYGTWGLLLALNALLVALIQYPLVRVLHSADRMRLLALASVLIGLGLGLSAFVSAVWPLAILVVILSFGEILLAPVASTVVSDMAPESVRGRYMGVWTIVWSGGASLGPALAGAAMDGAGSRQTFAALIAVGLAGGVGFLVLGRRFPRLTGRTVPPAAQPDRDGGDARGGSPPGADGPQEDRAAAGGGQANSGPGAGRPV